MPVDDHDEVWRDFVSNGSHLDRPVATLKVISFSQVFGHLPPLAGGDCPRVAGWLGRSAEDPEGDLPWVAARSSQGAVPRQRHSGNAFTSPDAGSSCRRPCIRRR